ncbi:MAG TPA: dihydrolipoamide acetyltransferase family protein [Clostridium sp.]|uniref:dihydrolipoamide acetyltransferase family protein n=1 Tax=Clostridium sp. TaxID=1506 RepID=UPI002F94EAAD
MASVVVMPKLGLTMTEGTISGWYKKEGEQVKTGENLFDVETDKMTNQIEATEDGFLRKIIVGEGSSADVTAPIAIIGSKDEDISGLLIEDNKVEEVKEVTNIQVKGENIGIIQNNKSGYIKASPMAKKSANENNIDLSLVKATGCSGNIVQKDVDMYLEQNRIRITPTAAKMAKDFNVNVKDIDSTGRIMKEDILKALDIKGETSFVKVTDVDERVRPSNMRKIIADRMIKSWNISPKVTYNIEIDALAMKEFREKLKESFKAVNAKLTYNHILMKIAAKSLNEFPYINASFDGKEIILHRSVNIGLAIAIEDGLMVPNIKNVQDKSLLDIALETEEIIKNTKSNKLSLDAVSGGTFTISNLGMFGMDTFSPIINQPELAILGVNAMVDKVVVINGEIVIRPMIKLSLTADHRVIDGAMAAKFLKRFADIVKNPLLLLM